MWKPTYYAIKNNEGQYMQGVQINENYCRSGGAPTMGNRHIPSDYTTVWGCKLVTFEPLTLVSNIKVLLDEYGNTKASRFEVIPHNEHTTRENY